MTIDLDDDDAPVGRVLSRREALAVMGSLGAGGLLFLSGCNPSGTTEPPDGSATCVARPALTEGPYFVDAQLERSDIRSDPASGLVKTGAPLVLTFGITRLQSGSCVPLENAMVDVWHCDALGVYSGVTDPGFDTRGQQWLRGYQRTDADGLASFTTIFPGWYQGRATHIHFKIRSVMGATYEFTSQLFFTEAFLTSLYTSQAPYTTKGDAGRLRNTSDGIYGQGGSQLLLTPASAGEGFTGRLNIALQV